MKAFMWLYLWLLLGCLLVSLAKAYGQQRHVDAGQPMFPTRFFLPSQYDAHSQNFAFTQDQRGVLYVGNFAGVLEYDGLNWRTIRTQNVTKATALLTAKNGRVYVGANNEFGYLSPDSTGLLGFVSLSRSVRFRFNEVLSVLEGADGIYFAARNGLFRWNGKTLNEWPVSSPITGVFRFNQVLYVAQPAFGLRSFENGAFSPVGKFNTIASRLTNVAAMLPLGGNQALLVSSAGLFLFSGNQVTPFSSPAESYLTANQPTSGVLLSDLSLAIGTVHGGLVILSSDGKLKQIVQEIEGLQEQPINALFVDRESNLWLGMNNGICQIEIPSPITLFSESARQTGEVMDIKQVRDVIYIASINGLFTYKNGGIEPVAELTAGSFMLTDAGGSLLVATSHGVYRVNNRQASHLTTDYSLCITVSRKNPDLAYVGTENGLGLLTLSSNRAPTYRLLPGMDEQVTNVVEDSEGNLWLETLTKGLYKLNPVSRQFTHYTNQQGLFTLLYNRIARTSQGLLAYNEKGIFRFAADRNRFVPYNPFHTSLPATAYWKNDLIEDGAGNLWTIEGNKKQITLYRKMKNGFKVVTVPFLSLSTLPINVIFPDKRGRVWFGGRDGIVYYDARIQKNYVRPFQTLIRQIQLTDDKPLFNGYSQSGSQPPGGEVTLPHAVNDVSFEFSAASFPVINGLTFSYKLDNYDQTWSDSTLSVSKKEYTNLPAGDYWFRVKARNSYNVVGREAVFVFRVLAPWYRSWWAISLAVIGTSLLIYWGLRWRLNRLVNEKQALETLIRERTEEVVSQKEELEKQSEELAVKNDQLEKIDLIVQSINAEIDFANLFQTILAKFSVIRNMDNASFLVYEKETNSFRFRALRNNRDLSYVESVQLSMEEVENRMLAQAVEEYEDIYRKDDVHYEPLHNPVDDLTPPKSLITIVIKNEERIDGFITLENSLRTNAFDARDLTMIRNLKEHLIAAFIKTRLLGELEATLNDLKNTQDELIRQERLASVGQLTKGIVDRILNPINYITNFSQLSNGLIDDQINALEQQIPTDTLTDALSDAVVLKNNLIKIQDHSNSTARILKDMQRLLKEKSRNFLETDLNSFVESKTRTAMQEIKPLYKDFPINLVLNLENEPIRAKLLPYEFGQVVQNMVSNSYYALYEKSKLNQPFEPEVRITTETTDGQVRVRFWDNGKGMPPREIEQLFHPFFTTKPTSAGTGLGLFMVKDIIETHRGKIEVISREGEFTEITMTLPTLNQ